ncbi:GNAT family N-acetyltransferase [Halalkalicoccus subterraneus]|uniref:GNAT family N-acetyltransferase n=1 Tax=Halalkalicoccus subterraneus TaxID=2675002 RepID=UPI000EFA99C8|nr:GNAT family N-acetyltransferase [Halalkalicoccus subterraneus]
MIREAREEEFETCMRILEGALLEVEPKEVRAAIQREDVLVAVGDGHVRGVLVLDGTRIKGIAVTRTHRGNGIGSALVGAAAERVVGSLVADFRPDVCPFYEALGFEIDRVGENRFQGELNGPR